MLGPARLLTDDRRAGVAVAEFGADHFVRLALLDLRDCNKLIEIAPQAAPLAAALRGVARGGDIALADLAALDFVGIQQLLPAPALQGAGELPREVDGIADTAVHAEA